MEDGGYGQPGFLHRLGVGLLESHEPHVLASCQFPYAEVIGHILPPPRLRWRGRMARWLQRAYIQLSSKSCLLGNVASHRPSHCDISCLSLSRPRLQTPSEWWG